MNLVHLLQQILALGLPRARKGEARVLMLMAHQRGRDTIASEPWLRSAENFHCPLLMRCSLLSGSTCVVMFCRRTCLSQNGASCWTASASPRLGG